MRSSDLEGFIYSDPAPDVRFLSPALASRKGIARDSEEAGHEPNRSFCTLQVIRIELWTVQCRSRPETHLAQGRERRHNPKGSRAKADVRQSPAEWTTANAVSPA
jgi:hypothetical protein